MDKRPRETQRANILEGAKRDFARTGKAATMADVAVAAGVSQGWRIAPLPAKNTSGDRDDRKS